MNIQNNKENEHIDSANDKIDYLPVLNLERFENYFEKQNFFSKKGILGSIYRFVSYFIFEILKIVEQFLGRKIYFNFDQSELSSKDNDLVQQLAIERVINKINRGGSGAKIYHDEPKLFQYNIEIGDIKPYSDAKRQISHYASGCSFVDRSDAFSRAIGEAVERFCLNCYKDADLTASSYEGLKNESINPFSIVSLSRKQRNEENLIIDGKSIFRWVKCHSLKNGKSYFVPAQLVYVSYNKIPEEPTLQIPISTGAATWRSLEGAIYRGLCEAIERDAFIIYYLNKIAPPQLNLDAIKNEKIRNIINTIKRYQLKLYLLDITTDIPVPVILAVIIDRSGVGPPISVGICANLDIFRAVEGAVVEATKIRISKRRLFEKASPLIKIEPKEITTFDSRKLFWRNPDLIKELDFMFQGPIKELRKEDIQATFDDDEKNLKKVLDYLSKSGIESFFVDITTPPVRKAGFFVVKTVAPKLQPLYLNENFRYLGGERLYQIPVKMGWREKPLKEEELNSLPHPFI